MEKFLKAFEEYCSVPGVKSNKPGSYAKGIQYLCEYLNISEINETSVKKIDKIKEYVGDRNSAFYSELLTFLERRNQKSYLEKGFIQAALKYFFDYISEVQSVKGGEKEMEGTVLDNIIKSLEELGGKGNYAQIYQVFERITKQTLTDGRKAGIRAAIEKNSSDSEVFSGNDIFYSVEGKGKGIWGLRNYTASISVKDKLFAIKKHIAAKGFDYEGDLIENFYLSLKSKPFVILAGTSGTGKTRLVRLFAEAIGATNDNGRYKLVSVRPDWSDSSDLFGHVNLQGEFVPGAIIDFIKNASDDLEHSYFLCLDEMNLARVEYYLSDFLSVIETRKWVDDRIQTDIITLDKAADKEYPALSLPENLYVIGTVNMDETTFPFSKKVLDRANTIEFSYVDLVPAFEDEVTDCKALEENNEFLKAQYITLKSDIDKTEREFVKKISIELQAINEILQEANAHVGYRVRDEIVFYMLNNEKAKLLNENEALDNEIMQKILPRIQGSGKGVEELLTNLFKKFAGDYSGISQDSKWKQMKTYIKDRGCIYKKSAEKICYMMRRFEEDGFTSYWL